MSDPKTTLLDWWLRYLKLGWAVFPLGPRSKFPLIPKTQGGNGCLDATLNETVVREWYQRYPAANIGLATGHRFFVLDVDPAAGGEDSFDYLRNQHGPFPNTIQQITGGGGKQLFFLTPDFHVHGSVKKLGPGLDIRGVGGYVVAPPSIHPVSGRRYEWDGLDLIEDQQLAAAPAWLLDWLRQDGKAQASQGDRPPPQKVSAQISEGGRNDAMFKFASSLRSKGFSEEEIFAMLCIANQERCSPPLPEKELRTIAGSAARRYTPDERGNLFPGTAPPPVASPPSGDLPLTPADVEAAIDEAIGRNDLVAAIRLAPDLAKIRPQFRAVIKAKLKQHFGRDFPESLAKEFDRAIRDAESDGDGQNPPGAPPPGAGGDDGEAPPGGGPNLLCQPMTDGGNGERVVALFGHEIRFCTEMKKWFVWDGKRWAIDEVNVMRQKGKLMARMLYAQALHASSQGLRDAFEAHARKSESYTSITNALGQAATEPGVPISALNLDQQPFLLNCVNGVVDLRSGKLLPHNREFLITKLCPVPFEPKTVCPQFQLFIEWAMGGNPDAELTETTIRLVSFLQRAIGYGLTADVSEKAVFVFYGQGGNNGKTTLLTLFRDLLGRDYSNLLLIDTIMTNKTQDSTARADMADLRGTRFVATSEVGKEDKLNEQRVKFLTQGMGWIKSRRLYENPIEFEATHKLFMDCNYRPNVRGTDDAIWRRLKLIPFEVTISEEEKDLHLGDKLRAEMPGVLAWAVRGCMAWYKDGLGEPPEVSSAGEEWRDDDDPLKEFIEDCCETEDAFTVTIPDIMTCYQTWAKQAGERFPLGRTSFNERLYAKKFKQERRRVSGVQKRVWVGLQLRPEMLQAVQRQNSQPVSWPKSSDPSSF